MSQKNSAPKIKLTGIKDGEGDFHAVTVDMTAPNANGRHYDPQALWEAVHSNRFNQRTFSTNIEHPISHKGMFQKYLGLVPDDDDYRGTPVQRHPFMRVMALRFGAAMESVRICNHRQTGKGHWMYYRLHQFHNHYLNETADIKASRPVPIDLTRYLRLLTGKDVWEKPGVGAWSSEFAELYFYRHQAGVGKSMFYNTLPKIKLYLKPYLTFAGIPYYFHHDEVHLHRGPAGYWPAVLEYGMSHNGPAFTDQINRERLVKPKKGRV